MTPIPTTPSASDALQKARDLEKVEKENCCEGMYSKCDKCIMKSVEHLRDLVDDSSTFIEEMSILCEGIAMHCPFTLTKEQAVKLRRYTLSLSSELERVTAERDAALKGYRAMRAGIKSISDARVIDHTQGLYADRDSIKKQFLDAHLEPIKKVCDNLLISFPEIK